MEGQVELFIPDIGDFRDVAVIEILFQKGDHITEGQAIATLESEKATLDVPAEVSGQILEVKLVPGSRVSKGSPLLIIAPDQTVPDAAKPATPPPPPPVAGPDREEKLPAPQHDLVVSSEALRPLETQSAPERIRSHASPSVRRLARELDVDLPAVKGSGPRGRILRSDVHGFVRTELSGRGRPEVSTPAAPDFSKFGSVERRPLSRIQKISSQALSRNWQAIPHVTTFEDADITELEEFRKALAAEAQAGARITLLSFLVKASAAALRAYPMVNASLDGTDLVLKHYVHVGIAVDTPGGLVVPVIRDADQLGVRDISGLIAARAAEAREGKVKAASLEGGCFTVSSLGGIGCTGFTPIINAPEVAILGVSRAAVRPEWNGAQFVPRQILPLALSWDHRALDGVTAAKFLVYLCGLLQDFRRASL